MPLWPSATRWSIEIGFTRWAVTLNDLPVSICSPVPGKWIFEIFTTNLYWHSGAYVSITQKNHELDSAITHQVLDIFYKFYDS